MEVSDISLHARYLRKHSSEKPTLARVHLKRVVGHSSGIHLARWRGGDNQNIDLEGTWKQSEVRTSRTLPPFGLYGGSL